MILVDWILDLWDRLATMPRRVFLYAALALAVPLPAFALTHGGAPAPPAALSVGTSLDDCGLIGTELVCKLDVSYDSVADATSYTAAVTRADGSVLDYGEVGAGGTSLWVPYVGAGNYSVQISAYGDPKTPGGHPRLLTRDESDANGRAPGRARATLGEETPQHLGDAPSGGDAGQGAGDEPGSSPSAPDCDQAESGDEQSPSEPGSGDDPSADPTVTDETSADSTQTLTSDELRGIPKANAAKLEHEAALPETVDCPPSG